MHKALSGTTITCYLCGKVYENRPDKAPPFTVVEDRAVCDDHLSRAREKLETYGAAYARLGRLVQMKRRHYRHKLTCIDLEMLDLASTPIPGWAAPHLKDYAAQAVERLIAKGLAERQPDGSIVAKAAQ